MSNQTIPLSPVSESRRTTIDYDSDLGFGRHFSDHMFSMRYVDGAWTDIEIMPYAPIPLEPGVATLHYGQIIFEGLKAFRGKDGQVRIFRPDMNAARLNASCERLCMPQVDPDLFVAATRALVAVDESWVPSRHGQALYIRPMMFGDEAHLDVRPSDTFRFLIITSPVRGYFDNSDAAIRLKIEERYTRAAAGGTGFAKTAGNYAASLKPGQLSREDGFDQVLWTDGKEHQYIEEVGQMNIFFRLGDRVVTPALRGTILPGVTRDSTLQLLSDYGFTCEEKEVSIKEILDACDQGQLTEAFGTSTAAIVAPVGALSWQGKQYSINDGRPGELSQRLYRDITGLHYGDVEDRHGWMVAAEYASADAA